LASGWFREFSEKNAGISPVQYALQTR